ncbi:MAG: PAS domain-containing protein [Mariprofundales bacterium]
MNNFFEGLVNNNADFIPHGFYFIWNETLVCTKLGIGLIIGLAYFIITGIIAFFIFKKRVNENKRKEAELKITLAALEKNEERFALAMKGANDGLWDWDLKQKDIFFSERWCSMLGYAKGELGKNLETWEALIHPDDIERAKKNIDNYLSQEAKKYETELRMRHKDGHWIDVLSRGFAVRDSNKKCVRFIGTHVDITDRKYAEKKVRLLNDKITNTFNISPGIIASANIRTGYFTEGNLAVTKVLGYSVEEFTSRPFIEFIHPDDRNKTANKLSHLSKDLPTINFKNRYLCKNGDYKWLSWQSTVADVNGMVYTVATDISLSKKAEDEREKMIISLEAKNTDIENFTYAVSHDLKSPLISIQGFVGMLKKDAMAGNNKRIDEDVEQIKLATQTMDTLLNELLAFSRVGRLDNPHEDIAMNGLVEEVIYMISGSISENIKINIQPDLPNLSADRPRIKTLLQNLIENAVKFMGNQVEPCINITATSKKHKIIYAIKDNGIGIDKAYHDNVFGMFEHLNTGIDGTGMGLALAKRIVEVHGGRIWAESDGEGYGTTFFFTLTEQEAKS